MAIVAAQRIRCRRSHLSTDSGASVSSIRLKIDSSSELNYARSIAAADLTELSIDLVADTVDHERSVKGGHGLSTGESAELGGGVHSVEFWTIERVIGFQTKLHIESFLHFEVLEQRSLEVHITWRNDRIHRLYSVGRDQLTCSCVVSTGGWPLDHAGIEVLKKCSRCLRHRVPCQHHTCSLTAACHIHAVRSRIADRLGRSTDIGHDAGELPAIQNPLDREVVPEAARLRDAPQVINDGVIAMVCQGGPVVPQAKRLVCRHSGGILIRIVHIL